MSIVSKLHAAEKLSGKAVYPDSFCGPLLCQVVEVRTAWDVHAQCVVPCEVVVSVHPQDVVQQLQGAEVVIKQCVRQVPLGGLGNLHDAQVVGARVVSNVGLIKDDCVVTDVGCNQEGGGWRKINHSKTLASNEPAQYSNRAHPMKMKVHQIRGHSGRAIHPCKDLSNRCSHIPTRMPLLLPDNLAILKYSPGLLTGMRKM